MPDFKTIEERQQWIMEHADYFTVFRLVGRNRYRYECPTLAKAEELARSLSLQERGSRWMIYAVHGVMDSLSLIHI